MSIPSKYTVDFDFFSFGITNSESFFTWIYVFLKIFDDLRIVLYFFSVSKNF